MAVRARLVRVAEPGVPEVVYWSDGTDYDEIVAGRIVAMRRGDRWVCPSGGKWVDSDFCHYELSRVPCWPDIAEQPEDDVATDPADAKYIKYEQFGKGHWFAVTPIPDDDDVYDDDVWDDDYEGAA
jgi:hypothetical protein